MGARRRLRSRGPVAMDVVAAHNRHLTLTFEDVRSAYEEAARRAEQRARREAEKKTETEQQ